MSALGGNLKDFGMAEIFQLIGQQRKSGVLELSSGNKRVEIQFDRGAIVLAAPVGDFSGAALADMLVRCGYASSESIGVVRRKSSAAALTVKGIAVENGLISKQEVDELENLLTKESLFDLLQWSTGSFEFKPGEIEHDRVYELMMGAEQILMDGLRMTDEWQNLADTIPTEDTVFRRVCADEAGRQLRLNPRISPEKAERVTLLIDGRASVRRIIDLSRAGTFDAMQVIVALREAGLIQVVASPRRRGRTELPLRKNQLSRLLAALLPLLLLMGLSLGTYHRANARFEGGVNGGSSLEPSSGLAFDQKPLESVRAAYAEMRAQHAIEDIRMATGRWPRDWGEVEELRPPGSIALAAAESPPYYYVRRENGVVLLAPAR